MRIAAFVACAAVVHIGSDTIAAQQPTNGLPPARSFESLFAPQAKPAAPPRLLFPTPTPTLKPAPKTTVSCGLTLIPGDPNVDPGIRQEIPADGPRYSIQAVDPKLCKRP